MRKNLLLWITLCIALPELTRSQQITFSPSRGFYTAPFQLSLTSTIGGTIRYTTDGSAPTTSVGTVYAGTISIGTTSVVRAIAVNGATVTPIVTNTYLFLNDVIRQPATIPGWPNNTYDIGLPGTTAVHDYAMDQNVVNDPAYSGVIIEAMKDIPTMSVVMNKTDFQTMYDGDLEFPASVEIINSKNPAANEQFNCCIESHSTLRLKRSMKLVINNTYFPSSLKSNIFKNAPLNGSNATDVFKKTKIVLRAGNNRSWARNWNPDRTCYTRDQWYRDAMIDVSGVGSHGTFMHLYVNGLYWGLFNPVERLDAGFESTYLGSSENDWLDYSQDGIRSGDATRFNYLTTTLVNKDMTVPANYAELKTYLDINNFSDYLLTTWMTGMTDWPLNNYTGGNNNNPAGPNLFYAWDAEWSWDNLGQNTPNNGAWVHPAFRNDQAGNGILTNLWHALRRNPDFMAVFADRVYRSCFNNGRLTDAVSSARWLSLNTFISKAIIGESARWGDGIADGITRTKNGYWQPEVTRVDALMHGNVDRFITALRAQGYYPTLDAPAFSRESGIRTANNQLTITNNNGTGSIYYTTDGTDPRLPAGGLSSNAVLYSGVINLTTDVTIKARIQNGADWSALHEGSYFAVSLKINEFMASNTSTLK
ncbi:MAG: chitobiase/beta-hexosaminidase C-terminal domain-containing protein, partial [Chitinophagaceae bacterium]